MILADFWTQNGKYLMETLHLSLLALPFPAVCCSRLLLCKTKIFKTFRIDVAVFTQDNLETLSRYMTLIRQCIQRW